jgi:GntR family transcriptional regulator
VIVRLTPGDPRPIYVQIMDEIRRAIVLGTLEADDPLPSTRELARDLRVNPNTVQLAYRELERIGVAYVRRGQGTYVANSNTPEKEHRRLVRDVAERAARDAYRHGINIEELTAALNSEAKRKPTRAKRSDNEDV